MSVYYTPTTVPGAGTRARAATIEDIIASLEVAFNNVEADITSAANFKGLWSSLTGPLNIPASVYHLSQYWNLASNLADVTLKVPGTDPEWIVDVTATPIDIPDWPSVITYDTGKISTVIYSYLTERYRQTITYTGDKLTSVVYAYSSNSGGTYGDIGTETLVYTGDELTSSTWTVA